MIFHDLVIKRCGAVAQLGARVNGIHEVAGSIPASSTKLRMRTRDRGDSKVVRPLRGEHARRLTKLARAAAFDPLATDRHFASSDALCNRGQGSRR